jgi:hypothetical protein
MTTGSASRCPVRAFRILWLLGMTAALLSGAWSSLAGAWPLWPGEAPGRPGRTPPMFDRPFDAPGIRQPAALPAAGAAELSDAEPVIGVSAGGRDRAYLVRALAISAKFHIVNDVLGGVPVSVTYCDLYECPRLFTGGATGESLDLSQGGLRSGSMVLKTGGHPYRQDTGAPLEEEAPPFPYDPYPGDVTTWGAWRGAHPDTDVYVADLPLALPQPQTSVISRAIDFLPHLLSLIAAPLLTAIITLLLHVLLAVFLGPRRRRGAPSSVSNRPAPGSMGAPAEAASRATGG